MENNLYHNTKYILTTSSGHSHFENRDDYREKKYKQIILQTCHTVNDYREYRGLDDHRGDLWGHGTEKKRKKIYCKNNNIINL
jgi:hypothetical protein